QPGTAKITVGDFALRLAPKDASGNLTILRELDLPCKVDADQNTVLTSFVITGVGGTTPLGTAASRSPSSTTPSTSTDVAGSTAATPTAARDRAVVARDRGGTVDVVFIALATLAAGAAVVLFGLWLRGRRIRDD